MANNGYIIVDNEPVENVNEFIYLGALITNNYDDTKEIRRRISIAKNATLALSNIWKTRSISLNTKKRQLNSLVHPIVTYGSECWVLKTSDKKRLESYGATAECSGSAGQKRKPMTKFCKELTRKETSECPQSSATSLRWSCFCGLIVWTELCLLACVLATAVVEDQKTRPSDNLKELCGPGQAGLDKNGGEGHGRSTTNIPSLMVIMILGERTF